MAIDDNAKYGLKGSQIKDLASRIKGNTKLARDLSGGYERTQKRVNIVRLETNDGDEIATQIGYESGSTITTTVTYGFYDVEQGIWLTRYEIGEAIDNNCVFEYIEGSLDASSSVHLKFYWADANYDSENDVYYPIFYFLSDSTSTITSEAIIAWGLNDNPNQGLEDMYTVDTTTTVLGSDALYELLPMDSAMAAKIANEINADHPGAGASSTVVQSWLPYYLISKKTGERITVRSTVRRAFLTNRTMFKPGRDMNGERLVAYDGNSYSFTIENGSLQQRDSYTFITATSSTDPMNSWVQYLGVVIESQVQENSSQTAYGYFDENVLGYAPDATFQVAYDSSNNLYMAADTNSASDWKRINNNGSYSTSEVKTGDTWIDGKPIYKKTFSFITNGSGVSTTVQHGISNLDVIIDYNGMLKQSSTSRQPVPRVVADNNSGYNIGVGDIGNTQFTFLVGTSVAKGVQAYVTLWYTKITD